MMTRLDELRTFYQANFPLYEHIGLEILEADGTSAKCHVPLTEHNVNHFGTMHAAIQWALCETLGGVIYLYNFGTNSPYLGVVTDVDMKFVRPASTSLVSQTTISEDELERIRRELESAGKANFSLDIRLLDTGGNLVGSAQADYHVRRRDLFQSLGSRSL